MRTRKTWTLLDDRAPSPTWLPLVAPPNKWWRVLLVWAFLVQAASSAIAQNQMKISIRGKPQTLRVYGPLDGEPVVVSSGDGGWIHLGPRVAEILSSKGYFVVGLDAKAYLSSFTEGKTTLSQNDVPGDYQVILASASRATGAKVILIGVSEGAGLSVLAATSPEGKKMIKGVIGLGLSNANELAWRWKDAIIYITKTAPDEPIFKAENIVQKVSPVPLAAIHSTHDEFVPVAEVQRVMSLAREPKRLWIVEASDHRFSGNTVEFEKRLWEAIDWIKANQPKP